MKKQLLVFVFLTFLFPCMSLSATHNLPDCSYATVDNFINHGSTVGGLTFTRNDTVVCPADTKTWSTQLPITKGVILRGNGIGSTNITSTQSDGIWIQPDATALANNERIEIANLTYTGDSRIYYYNYQTTAAINMVINSVRFNGSGIYIEGMIYGVVYNSQFVNRNMVLFASGPQDIAWNNSTAEPGTYKQFWFEDCSFESDSSVISGHGGRYGFRYNTFGVQTTSQTWDMHGNQTGGIYATMLGEFYGNLFLNQTRSRELLEQRGGVAMVFNNKITGNSNWWIYVVDEYDDCDTDSLTNYSCPDSSCSSCASDGTYQKPNKSYYWNNYSDSTYILAEKKVATCWVGDCTITENVNWWDYNSSCSGSGACSSGVGVGTSAPTGSCTTGVGFWVWPNGTTLSSDMATMRSQTQAGVFYKCTSTNTWTQYYTPYTYPHPLRSGSGDTTAPSVAITTIDGSSNTSATYATSSSTVTLAGTATDAVGVTSVTWDNDRDASPAAACGGTLSAWSQANIILSSGVNVITIRAYDAAGNIGTDVLTVTYSPPDTTPDQFTFTDEVNVTLSTVKTSNTITVAGISASAAVTVSGGTYSKNGAAYTPNDGTAVVGDTFSVRQTSSSGYSTSTSVILSIGGVTDAYTVTTISGNIVTSPVKPVGILMGNGVLMR